MWRVLYLFAGRRRQNSVAAFLRKGAKKHGLVVEITEVDVQRNRSNDLTIPKVQQRWPQAISSGRFDALVTTPRCSTFSRAVWANDRGPPPLRSSTFPRGFPWLRWGRRRKAEFGNILADVSFEAFKRQVRAKPGVAVMEQPEDLGAANNERIPHQRPASMWQFHQFKDLLKEEGVTTVALAQLDFGAETPKPTRLLLRVPGNYIKLCTKVVQSSTTRVSTKARCQESRGSS